MVTICCAALLCGFTALVLMVELRGRRSRRKRAPRSPAGA